MFYGLVFGVFSHYTSDAVSRIAITVGLILITKLLSTRSFSDTLMIAALAFPIITPVSFLVQSLMRQFIPNELMMHALVVVCLVLLCYKLKFYQFFNYIKTNTLVKALLFIVVLVTLSFLFYMNFDNNPADMVFYLLIICFAIVGFIPVIIRLYKRVEIDVGRAHFIGNKIVAARNTAYLVDDVEKLRQMFDELVHHISPEIGEKPPRIDHPKQAILEVIEQKKKHRNADVDVITDLRYYEDYDGVKFEQILSFIGALLDNAFEVETEKPIIVYFSCAAHSFDLSISNEYLQTSNTDLDLIFEKGYSTKSEDGRGYGLYEVKQEVEALNGRIVCFETYLEHYKARPLDARYLVFTIQFGFKH
ncbi:MAG: hypothetical protein FWG67_06810 [Defluviitaleaceae bacterium]|nr:hypothetical protein [Defluviitaleaceae bacterium]